MSKAKKRQQAIESGILHRNGSRLTREELEHMVQPPARMPGFFRPRRRGIVMAPVNKCSKCDENAVAVVGGVFYCEEHLLELTKPAEEESLEAENGKEDSEAVHNADSSGRDERGETPGDGGDPSGSKEALRRNARRRT